MTATKFNVGQVVRFVDADDAGYRGSRRGELYKITDVPSDGIQGIHMARHADGTHIGVYGHRFEAVTDFQAGDDVRVVKAGARCFWYSNLIGQTFKLNGKTRLMSDGINYGTDHDGDVIAGRDIELVGRPITPSAPARVPGTGDRVRVVKSGQSNWWYARRIGDVFTLTGGPINLGDGINYSVTEPDTGFIALGDVELVVDDAQKSDQQEEATMDFTNIENRTIAQIKAKLEELNTTIASAQAEIKVVEDERDGLVAQLKAVGIVIEGTAAQVSPAVRSYKDAYDAQEISVGDKLLCVSDDTSWFSKGREYEVLVVDYSDGSVRMSDDVGDRMWVWVNSQGQSFQHIPA